ncbi:MAG: putative lipid II flippase FtsW [Proteobacteria bacterium]|nr:putative lipid II flippase FtsW [Pseudomonadota bacterium]
MAHRTNRPSSIQYDLRLLIPVISLVGIGIIMIYSSSSAIALKKFGSDYYFIKKQVTFALSGMMLLLIFRHFPYRLFHKFAYPFIILSCIFLTLLHLPDFGLTAGGATRWLRLGTFSFQPAEFARFAMVLYLAYSLSKKQDNIKDPLIGFLPHVIILSLLSLLILSQPDFGSAAILAALTWIMMFIGGVRLKHLLLSLLPILPLVLMFMISAEYRLRRLLTFMNPWEYPAEEGYQIIHSLMAFGTGGLFGTGIGKGYQKLFYLPEPHTDFIFSVIGEELGLIGVLIILALYMVILWRGIDIAKHSKDKFGCFMAVGITTAMGLQVCINMGVALGLLPTKGLTLPFLSYGGTSLVLNMACIGILMNIGASQSK